MAGLGGLFTSLIKSLQDTTLVINHLMFIGKTVYISQKEFESDPLAHHSSNRKLKVRPKN